MRRRVVSLGCIALAGCGPHARDAAPPRATDRIHVPLQTTTIAVPVRADLNALSAALEKAIPRKLWAIDRSDQVCVASSKVKLVFAKIKTPTLRCRILGSVERGRMTLSGSGSDLVIAMPLHATIAARDVGGVLKQAVAHADARVRAVVRLDVAPNWSPQGTIRIAYDWTDDPHVDVLGQRIEFTSKADMKLKRVVAQLERTLPRELAKLRFRQQVEQAWSAGFTSLQLNAANPPVWMRISPQRLNYGGYSVQGRTLTLRLGMTATTETFVGPRPADPPKAPLPPVDKVDQPASEVLFTIPVIADYAALEPVLARALARRAQRPFNVAGIGAVTARFGKVTLYGTQNGRIAVGLEFSAAPANIAPARGTVWLTARPVSLPNSRRVTFTDLGVAGVTDSTGTALLLKLANAPGVADTIAQSLSQNFSNDYDTLLGKIGQAIEQKRQGDLLIRARITDVRTGKLQAAGQGVYLPVWGKGTASITLDRR